MVTLFMESSGDKFDAKYKNQSYTKNRNRSLLFYVYIYVFEIANDKWKHDIRTLLQLNL